LDRTSATPGTHPRAPRRGRLPRELLQVSGAYGQANLCLKASLSLECASWVSDFGSTWCTKQ
jgi:hypothetical protein